MASLQNWAKAGPEALTTPTTGTGLNPVDLSTPGSASQEHHRRQEEHTKRKADEAESESSSSEEKEEESPISLDSDEEEYQGSEQTRNASVSSQPAHYPVDASEEVLPLQTQGSLEEGAGQ